MQGKEYNTSNVKPQTVPKTNTSQQAIDVLVDSILRATNHKFEKLTKKVEEIASLKKKISQIEKHSCNVKHLDDQTLSQVLLAIYPIGALYISTSSVNPGSLFGGTWQSIEEQLLFDAGWTVANNAPDDEDMQTTMEENSLINTNDNEYIHIWERVE